VPIGFGGAQFLMDCTSHFRDRVHPGQRRYYRGDKGAHFLTAQVTTNVYGFPLNVQIGVGHNNDQGIFNATIRNFLEHENVVGLADRAYHHILLLRPDDRKTMALLCYDELGKYSSAHSAARSPVEILNSLTKTFYYAAARCHQSPEFQAFALILIYVIVAMQMSECPTFFITKVRGNNITW